MIRIFILFVMLTVTAADIVGQEEKTFHPADNKAIAYIGRFDFSDSKQPSFMYSGCAVRTKFKGTSVEVVMKDDSLRNMFTVTIDDSISVLTTNKEEGTYLLAEGLKNRKHNLEIIRRTEWHGGNSAFIGFKLDNGRKLYKPEIKKRKIEFIGDSYTCGYGNEGQSREEHFRYETENNYLTYGALAARELNAEYVAVCRSGIGMVQGYGGGKDFNMPRLYDEVVINATKGWDYTRFQPQVVVIDLGSNDLSAPLDSAQFVVSYAEFLKRIRNNYAPAKIICAAGPSSPEDETWEKWKAYVHAAVDQYRQKDNNVYYFEFSTFRPNGSDWHPNVEEHRRMSGELVPFIEELMKW